VFSRSGVVVWGDGKFWGWRVVVATQHWLCFMLLSWTPKVNMVKFIFVFNVLFYAKYLHKNNVRESFQRLWRIDV
jgi:hypothetical protein